MGGRWTGPAPPPIPSPYIDGECQRVIDEDHQLPPDDPADIQCPVCGYYCLGRGGHGCIDKPALQRGVMKA